MKRDYYEVLGLKKRTSADEIKRAFRRLAQRYHPDKNPGDPTAEDRFKEVNEAYAVLSDPDKRRDYDRFGHLIRGEGAAGFEGVGEAFSDLFGDLFAGRKRRQSRGADLRYSLEISFEEAAFGVEKEIALPRFVACATCSGSGAEPPTESIPCRTCEGSGEIKAQQGFFSVARLCPECSGTGRKIEHPCSVCEGRGQVLGERRLKVKVPAGVDTGQRLRLSGEGEEGVRGGGNGDLFVIIRVRPHPLFVRDENDIVCDMPVSFPQVALGATVEVPTLDGKVKMRIPAGTQSGKIFRLREKGIPALGGFGRGDQLVRVMVETPSRMSDDQKEALRRFTELSGEELHPAKRSFLEKVRELFG
jgi:molecular chaperone DnaJ